MKRLLALALLAGAPSFAQGMLLERGLDGPSAHLRPVRERVSIRIEQQHAQTLLEQEFENVSGERLEGRYLLRTAGAAVEGFAYWNGEQKIVGEVFEKQSARELYGRVVGKGRDPGLLEQTGEGSFAFDVFPIEPHERKRIEIRLGQRLARVGTRMEYRLTLAGGESDVVAEIADDHPLVRVDSPSHPLTVERVDARHARVRAQGDPAGPRDLVLDVDVEADPWQPSVTVHRDPGQDAYIVLQMAAPARVEAGEVSAKDVTLVIDRSGSMTGAPLQQACAAAEMLVRRLRPGDRVNVIAFDHSVDPLFRVPRAVEGAREAALQFIRRLRAGGGTNIALALRTALAAQNGGHEPHLVLLLTDGQSDSESALRVAAADTGDARVFTLGLGPGVEKPLLSRMAAMKRGSFTYIESPEAIEQRIGRLFDRIESPALIGLSLEARGATFERIYPRSLPDLSAGDDLIVVARAIGAAGAPLTLAIHGTLAGRQVAYPVRVELPAQERHPWVARSWAKARIDDLLEEMALTRDPPAELRDEAIGLGIAYDLVTPWTSFLAVPGSELGASESGTLAEMRARRARVLAANPDAAALSRRSMPPGDPVLTVTAPRDAQRVTAIFPFGLMKDLHWDEQVEKWIVRFLVPKDVPDGTYRAEIAIVRHDGTVELATASYTIDSKAPDCEIEVADGRIRVRVSEPARKVTVASLADPRRRIVLRGDGTSFEGEVPAPGRLRVVVADLARNETVREIDPR